MLPHNKRKTLSLLLASAFAAPAFAAPEITNVYDLAKDYPVSYSDAFHISSDGTIATGHSYLDDKSSVKATLWQGASFTNRILLPSLESKHPSGEANIISRDKKVVGGYSTIPPASGSGRVHDLPVIWSGENFQTLTRLPSESVVYTSHNPDTPIHTHDGEVFALSGDGKIAGGLIRPYEPDPQNWAAIWSGDNWQTLTRLPTLREDNKGHSEVIFLSQDGKTALGYAADSKNNTYDRAVVWSGNNWEKITDLGTLAKDNSGNSAALFMTDNGKFVTGEADNDQHESRAVIWHGENWQNKTDLGTLKTDNSGESLARSMSQDGKVAVGLAASDKYEERATLWSGNNWQDKLDLGTLRSDNSGISEAFSVSADGTVVAGIADADDTRGRATIWRIRYDQTAEPEPKPEPTPKPEPKPEPTPQPTPEPTPQPEPKPEPEPPVTPPVVPPVNPGKPIAGKGVDVANTRAVLHRLGRETLAAAQMQRNALQRVHNTCLPEQKGQFCYRAEADYSVLGKQRDTAVGGSFGYAFSDNFSAAFSLDRSLNRRTPDLYRNENGQSAGVSAQWRMPSENGSAWFVRPSAAWNSYRLHSVRPTYELDNTEAAEGGSKMKGVSFRLTAGQEFKRDSDKRFGWYAGAEHSRLTRNGYTETGADFPVTYGDFRYRDTALLLGADAELPLAGNLNALLRADAAYSVNAKAPVYTAEFMNETLGTETVRYSYKQNKARGTVAAGLGYRFSPAVNAHVLPYIGRSADGQTLKGVNVGLRGSF
ncbi:MAG: autotransporter domain-containing protein [Neisseria sp.]|nr:autotransporter domain-containing protein [Neisseria sp.]